MVDLLGWVATIIFVASYFTKNSVRLRIIQAFAALLWISYGFVIGSMPVVISNLLVAALAVYSSFTRSKVNE